MVQIASIGVHIIDVLGRPVSEIPTGQNIALIDEIRVTVAGTAGGTAVDLAKLGADVSSMGATGDDERRTTDAAERHWTGLICVL